KLPPGRPTRPSRQGTPDKPRTGRSALPPPLRLVRPNGGSLAQLIPVREWILGFQFPAADAGRRNRPRPQPQRHANGRRRGYPRKRGREPGPRPTASPETGRESAAESPPLARQPT